MYIGARFGAGPRDGLMTGLVRRTGASVGVVKTSIEVGVVVSGWLLGGTVGVATVAFALTVGPLVHVFLPRFTVPEGERVQRRTGPVHQVSESSFRRRRAAARANNPGRASGGADERQRGGGVNHPRCV